MDKHKYLINFFVNSFVRRNFSEMASCLDDDFIYETIFIRVQGRDKFVKLQEKFDCNYKMSIKNLDFTQKEGIYHASFYYEIYYPGQKIIKLDANAVLFLRNNEIYKLMVTYSDEKKAKTTLEKMILH